MTKRRKTGQLITEEINPKTVNFDSLSPIETIELISEEDKKVAEAVAGQMANIVKAVDLIANALGSGGRLLFIGAGTSGRLGVMEAAECPPTFGTHPNMIEGIIAGGKKALWHSIEGAEDSEVEGKRALIKLKLDKKDVVVGITASGTTPFVAGALAHAKKKGCAGILVACNPVSFSPADVIITLLVGPEVIVGSTRMKAGTATKMVLNMLTTASMVRLGRTYGNLMVEVQANSEKLKDRAKRIVMRILGADVKRAGVLLKKADWNIKAAVVMGSKRISYKEAKELLARCGGFLREALK